MFCTFKRLNKDETWIKKGENPSFDVTMGSFDGAEVCELVGLYLLQKLSPLLGIKNFGLYRDDGLAAVNTSSGPVLDRMRKNIISLFKEEGLSITIEINLVENQTITLYIYPCKIKPLLFHNKRSQFSDFLMLFFIFWQGVGGGDGLSI